MSQSLVKHTTPSAKTIAHEATFLTSFRRPAPPLPIHPGHGMGQRRTSYAAATANCSVQLLLLGPPIEPKWLRAARQLQLVCGAPVMIHLRQPFQAEMKCGKKMCNDCNMLLTPVLANYRSVASCAPTFLPSGAWARQSIRSCVFGSSFWSLQSDAGKRANG